MCRTRRTRLVFKGGTSLLKAHGLITRFTQDVDLVVVRAELGFAGNEDPMKAFSEVSKKQRQRLIERKAERAPCGRCDPLAVVQRHLCPSRKRTLVHLGRYEPGARLVGLHRMAAHSPADDLTQNSDTPNLAENAR